MRQMLVDQDLVNALATYLVEKPYKEVAGLLQRLGGAKLAPEASNGADKSTKISRKRIQPTGNSSTE